MADTIDDSGPAFPTLKRDPWDNYEATGGMSLRDWFAGQALAGIYGSRWFAEHAKGGEPSTAAVRAYEIADAMLAARGGQS